VTGKKQRVNEITISGRKIGPAQPPFVIAEVGINHEGDIKKAIQMVDDAKKAGAECIKFQSHVVEDEMVPVAKKVVPGHTTENIWDIMVRCSLSEAEAKKVKDYVESKGMIYLCTPFSRAAADRLKKFGVEAFKIGSGECNNYPLIEHIAKMGKPVIMSTGMNDLKSIAPAVKIFEEHNTPYVLMQCTSMYPTPYEKVRLGSIKILREAFPSAVVGSSDHSLGIYTGLAAVALGASVIEKHFTSDKTWPGPDIAISIDPSELEELVKGSKAVYQALGGTKEILSDEQDIIDFAYACVVTIKEIKKGNKLTMDNIWVKRPGTGQIKAVNFKKVLGNIAKQDINVGEQLKWSDFKKGN
jgi:sialic acid synthase SpsE